MALSDVMKKREATNEGKEKKQFDIKNIMDDVRIVIAVIVIACIALILLIVYNNAQIGEKLTEIDTLKAEIRDNQYKIAGLKALQARSGEYLQQKEALDKMISDKELNELDIMIELEKEVEEHNCNLTEITFDTVGNNGYVNQLPVTLKITGSFEDIMRFCQYETGMTEIRRIDTIRMDGSGTDDIKSAEILLVLFSK